MKEIIDTLPGNGWFVRSYFLNQDAVAQDTEHWYFTGGKFFFNSILLYDSLLTHDTSWTYSTGSGSSTRSYTHYMDFFFGDSVKAQKYEYADQSTLYGDNGDYETAVGVGIVQSISNSFGGEIGDITSLTLLGFIDNGHLYGDTTLTNVGNRKSTIPIRFSLHQNYPNPFNPVTTINYDLPRDVRVSLKVYDILGQLVKTLVDGYETAGYKSAKLNGANLPSGVYLYRLEAGNFSNVKKLVLMK
ncbi:MAG TPA: T9SS type A sorting domain-containing protein [Bacteroidota bacterium]|nr:T9SS type A sorting domain-containing protein [Bacteroidota bacterium]